MNTITTQSNSSRQKEADDVGPAIKDDKKLTLYEIDILNWLGASHPLYSMQKHATLYYCHTRF